MSSSVLFGVVPYCRLCPNDTLFHLPSCVFGRVCYVQNLSLDLTNYHLGLSIVYSYGILGLRKDIIVLILLHDITLYPLMLPLVSPHLFLGHPPTLSLPL